MSNKNPKYICRRCKTKFGEPYVDLHTFTRRCPGCGVPDYKEISDVLDKEVDHIPVEPLEGKHECKCKKGIEFGSAKERMVVIQDIVNDVLYQYVGKELTPIKVYEIYGQLCGRLDKAAAKLGEHDKVKETQPEQHECNCSEVKEQYELVSNNLMTLFVVLLPHVTYVDQDQAFRLLCEEVKRLQQCEQRLLDVLNQTHINIKQITSDQRHGYGVRDGDRVEDMLKTLVAIGEQS